MFYINLQRSIFEKTTENAEKIGYFVSQLFFLSIFTFFYIFDLQHFTKENKEFRYLHF